MTRQPGLYLQSGKLLQILRPPIGDFDEGRLFAVAISPDGRDVAVGGFTGKNSSSNFPIYLFDRETGAIRKTTEGLPDVTLHLAFSEDGLYLAAALGGKNGIGFTKHTLIRKSPATQTMVIAPIGLTSTVREDWRRRVTMVTCGFTVRISIFSLSKSLGAVRIRNQFAFRLMEV